MYIDPKQKFSQTIGDLIRFMAAFRLSRKASSSKLKTLLFRATETVHFSLKIEHCTTSNKILGFLFVAFTGIQSDVNHRFHQSRGQGL